VKDRIDQLYQVPLEEFTAARNALAKEAGKQGPEIKRLEKPNLAAWAVNQLYWRDRKTYDELTAAAEKLRAAHRQTLAGKAADLRAVETAHRDAIRKATQSARDILAGGGAATSDAVMTAVSETLDALPSADPPGRLTRPLKRSGFEALQGFAVAPGAKPFKPKVEPPKKQDTKPAEPPSREHKMTMERLRFAEAAAREAEAALERTRRAAERAERVVERLEGELAEAVKSATDLRKEEAARKTAHDKAVSERERLATKLA
jgi:hypothetical protein